MNNNQKIDRNAIPFIILIVLILGILLGYLATSIINGAKALNSTSDTTLSTDSFYDQKYLANIYNILNQSYLGTIPDNTKVTEGLVKGLISSLDDQYTVYLTPEEAAEYNKSKDPDFEGIGVSLKYDGSNTEVETVLDDNPAQKAGLKVGDVIAEVDGVSVLGDYPTLVAGKIRGEKDTTVSIKLYRKESNGENKLIQFNIKRDTINIDNINYEDLGNGIFKINIKQFTDRSAEAFNVSWDKVVKEVIAKNPSPKGIIVDLRNNPGGYVYSLRFVLEDFFKNGVTLMSEEKKNTDTTVYKDERIGRFEDTPIVVLVNEGSASASEIFASAVQDNKRGEIVGEKTVGKGVEQTLVNLDDNSLLIMVFQKWLRPNGNQINKDNPITPDYIVDYTDSDVKKGVDPQLNKALELLK